MQTIKERPTAQDFAAAAFGWNTPEQDDAEFARLKAAYNAPLPYRDDRPREPVAALEKCFVCDPPRYVRPNRFRLHMSGHGITV